MRCSGRSLALLLSAGVAASNCAQGPELRGQIAGLEKIVDQAERNGAMRCAPRELAIARSQLEFASIELDQGFASKARAHLAKAEPNARAADLLSPPQYCRKPAPIARAGADRDGDGLPDPADQCPDQPENYNGYRDEDGCPDDPDSDGDGVPDSVDQCEMQAEDKDGYLDDDGCPEPDNDQDGLTDLEDQCPNEIGSMTRRAQFVRSEADKEGCLKPVTPQR